MLCPSSHSNIGVLSNGLVMPGHKVDQSCIGMSLLASSHSLNSPVKWHLCSEWFWHRFQSQREAASATPADMCKSFSSARPTLKLKATCSMFCLTKTFGAQSTHVQTNVQSLFQLNMLSSRASCPFFMMKQGQQ